MENCVAIDVEWKERKKSPTRKNEEKAKFQCTYQRLGQNTPCRLKKRKLIIAKKNVVKVFRDVKSKEVYVPRAERKNFAISQNKKRKLSENFRLKIVQLQIKEKLVEKKCSVWNIKKL